MEHLKIMGKGFLQLLAFCIVLGIGYGLVVALAQLGIWNLVWLIPAISYLTGLK